MAKWTNTKTGKQFVVKRERIETMKRYKYTIEPDPDDEDMELSTPVPPGTGTGAPLGADVVVQPSPETGAKKLTTETGDAVAVAQAETDFNQLKSEVEALAELMKSDELTPVKVKEPSDKLKTTISKMEGTRTQLPASESDLSTEIGQLIDLANNIQTQASEYLTNGTTTDTDVTKKEARKTQATELKAKIADIKLREKKPK